jgi:hypothetical protein
VGRSIALLFLDLGARRGWVAALPPGKTQYPLYRRLGGPQGRSGRVRKISPPTGIRSPDRPARSQSLYRLSYPAPLVSFRVCLITCIVLWGGGKYGNWYFEVSQLLCYKTLHGSEWRNLVLSEVAAGTMWKNTSVPKINGLASHNGTTTMPFVRTLQRIYT